MKLIKVSFPESRLDSVKSIVEELEPTDWMQVNSSDSYEVAMDVLVEDGREQQAIDKLQDELTDCDDWRITVLPVDVSLPRKEEDEEEKNGEENEDDKPSAFREGLYESVEKGSKFGIDFSVLTILSVIVAAIGLHNDSVEAVIAAMVIAPLLGPMLGFSLGAALGDIGLMFKSAKTVVLGTGIAFFVGILLFAFVPLNTESQQLASRAILRPEMIALALAAGGAAALSLTTGTASALVGVMVAVALLPPLVAAGMFFGGGEYADGIRALVVLAVNIICTVLAAQIVFVWKGIRPRTWWEKKTADRSVRINFVFWGILLVMFAGVIYFLGSPSD